MPTPLSTALYIRRKKNRRRNMPNVKISGTVSGLEIEVVFNQNITATNYLNGWQFVIDGKAYAPTAFASGADKVNFDVPNTINKGEQIYYIYKANEGDYRGERGEIMQSSTGYVFNLV